MSKGMKQSKNYKNYAQKDKESRNTGMESQ